MKINMNNHSRIITLLGKHCFKNITITIKKEYTHSTSGLQNAVYGFN